MKKIYLASAATACLMFGFTSAVQAQQVYDEKFEITDPTFEQRSAQERALEQGQAAPAAAQPAKPGKKKKGEKKAEAAPEAPPAKWSDTLTVDRIESLRGPSSLLAGVVEPGGMINQISKRPRTRDEVSTKLTVGSWDYVRGELDASLPLNNRLATRFVFVRQAGMCSKH